MGRAARNIANELVGTLGRADYEGDYWRSTAAALLSLLLAVLYTLRFGFSVEDSPLVFLLGYAAIYLILTWRMILRTTPDQTRSWAISQDRKATVPASRPQRILRHLSGYSPGRGKETIIMWSNLAGAMGVLLAFVVAVEGTSEGASSVLLPVLGVAVFWSMLHTSYALYYAYLYYSGDDPGGLEFPGDEEPDHLDFAYYAFAVGTTFGVSDVAVTSKPLRRTTLLHGVISFAYGTAILALVINALVRGL